MRRGYVKKCARCGLPIRGHVEFCIECDKMLDGFLYGDHTGAVEDFFKTAMRIDFPPIRESYP